MLRNLPATIMVFAVGFWFVHCGTSTTSPVDTSGADAEPDVAQPDGQIPDTPVPPDVQPDALPACQQDAEAGEGDEKRQDGKCPPRLLLGRLG